VRSDEIEARSEADHTVDAFVELAVAQASGFCHFARDSREAAEMLQVLQNPCFQRYYEEYYPMLPPHLLRLHLAGGPTLPADQLKDGESAGIFQWYSSLRARFSDDPLLEVFLRLLDDFYFGDYGLPQLIRDLGSPASNVSERQEIADTALFGMFRFLNLCSELAAGLSEMNFAPRTRAMIWFGYAYWFGSLRKNLMLVMDSALRRLQTVSQADFLGARGGAATVDDVKLALDKLTSDEWAQALIADVPPEDPVLERVLRELGQRNGYDSPETDKERSP
jgi:hypothetical protein